VTAKGCSSFGSGANDEQITSSWLRPRVVKILELTETMDYGPTAPNGLWKTLRANSGSCNVMLRPSRLASLGRHVQPAPMIGFERSSSLTIQNHCGQALASGERLSLRVLVRLGRIDPGCGGHGAAAMCATVNSRGAGLRPGTNAWWGSGCRCRGWSVRSCGAGDFNLSSLKSEGCRRRDGDCRTWATPLGGTPGLR
jgi:hypothetical protein